MPPSLLVLLLSVTAHATPEAMVDVLGVGTVKLEHAMKSCLADAPQGEVQVATGNHRVSAFQEVLRGVYGLEPEARSRYFQTPDAPVWPVVDADVTYQPPVEWVPAGLIGACEAAGAWWVRHGIDLAEVCPTSRTECAARFAPEEQALLKQVLKEAKKGNRQGRDPFFAALNRHHEGFESWSNPQVYLQKACDWPQVAAGHRRFVDREDLVAARRACLQLQMLVTHADAPAPLQQTCDTPWRDTAGDAAHLVAAPHTDLGITGVFPDEQLDTLRDRLHRMDPSPGTCDAPWASLWRQQLVDVWREAQLAGACADSFLTLNDRVHLCPDLAEVASRDCEAGKAAGCGVAGAMFLQGVGADRDEERGAKLLVAACAADYTWSCEELRNRVRTLNGWFNDRFDIPPGVPDGQERRAALDAAHTLLVNVRPYMEPAWTRAQVERLFRAAVAARYRALADTVLTTFAESADKEWLREAKRQAASVPRDPRPGDEG